MTLTQLYAAVCLPLLLARGVYELLLAYAALDDTLTPVACVGVFLAFSVLGWEFESYYFREVWEGKGRIPRLLWFALGVPALYGVALALGVLLHAFFQDLPLLIPLLLSLLALAPGLWFLLTDHHHRGRRVYTQRYMGRLAQADLPPGDEGIPFGGIRIPTEKLATHVCLVGTTGSGKTTCIKQIMEATIPTIGKSADSRRGVIYDPKGEFYTYVAGLASCPVYSLHAFDRRGRSWNMCNDIRHPKAASQFAVTLLLKQEGPNSYFSNAARGLVRGVLTSYVLNTPDAWTFRDLILGCKTEYRLRAILGRSPHTTGPISKYLDAREKSSILSELDTHLDEYSPIAACWARAEPISLREWTEGEFILILALDEAAPESLNLINSLMLRFMTQQLLRHKTNEQLRAEAGRPRFSFLILDELRDIAGGLDKPLKDPLNRGRAYGISVTGAWCSHSGLKDAVNQNVAQEIIGLCSYKGMLRVSEEETAQYFSNLCAGREVYRKSGDGNSHPATETAVLPSTFSELGSDTLQGFFLAPPPLGLWKAALPWPQRQTRKENPPADFLPRPNSDQYLEPWTQADLERLELRSDLLNNEEKQANEAAKIPTTTRRCENGGRKGKA